VYPGPLRAPITSANPLTGVFTATVAMTLQIVGPTTRCPRATTGNITCAEVRVPPGATTYGFYNFEANPDIIWVHNLYLDGVAQPVKFHFCRDMISDLPRQWPMALECGEARLLTRCPAQYGRRFLGWIVVSFVSIKSAPERQQMN